MPNLMIQMGRWGVKNGKGGARKVLQELYLKGVSQTEIARMFKCSRPAVGYLLKRWRIECKPRTFLQKVVKAGYPTLESFFTDRENVKKTFIQLGKEMGVTYVTVSQWYNKFLKAREEKKRD